MMFTIPLVLAMMMAPTVHGTNARQSPTECADGSMTLWMQNSNGKNPCELVQDVLRVCEASYQLEFLPRGYSCNNTPGSALAPCCCGSPTFALMSACWSCQYNVTFDLVSTTFTSFERGCQALPDPITTYEQSVRGSIAALNLPAWSEIDPPAGKWDFTGAWRNATPNPTQAPPMPTGYPIVQVSTTGISKGALAGAIIGAILGSKILFMTAGYLFWRWWKGQPGNQGQDDDEKGYAHRVLGEPRYGRRLPGRSRRSSRAHVDLDEDTASPRSSRWLGVPSYLQPTSFHSHSSRSNSPPGQRPDLDAQQPSGSRYHDAYGPFARGEEGGVTPFITDHRPVESEKSRRRQSTSLRVTNEHQMGEENDVMPPAPQPALLAHAQSVSPGPISPPILSSSPRSNTNSRSNSTSTSNLHGHGRSGSISSTRYQEDDAGVSLVIEEGGSGDQEVIRSVPPAYVDYRKGYSNSSKVKLQRRDTGSDLDNLRTEGSSSAHGEGSGSGTGGSESGRAVLTSDSASATYIGSSGSPTRAQSIKKDNEHHDTDTVDARTMTETNTVREPDQAQDGSEARDRTTSGDSEGAATIKPAETPAEPERPGAVERSSTSEVAALTAANTVANRGGASTPNLDRPPLNAHTSAPAGVTFAQPEAETRRDDQMNANGSPQPQPANTEHSPSNGWNWGRALGVFGLSGPAEDATSGRDPRPDQK